MTYRNGGRVAVLWDSGSRTHEGEDGGGDLHSVLLGVGDDGSSARTSEAQEVNESRFATVASELQVLLNRILLLMEDEEVMRGGRS